MIILVWILCSALVTLVAEAVVCAPFKPNLAPYGSYCDYSSQCQTNYCTGITCACPSGTYYHNCSYSCVPNCNTTIYSSFGFLVSPNYPNNYKNNENCYWTIYRATGHVVSFTITDYSVESYNDTIKVYDGSGHSSPLIGAISLSNNSFVARSSYMHIVFKTDSSGTNTGFNGTFQIHACTTTLYSTYGNIMSPGYPSWSMRNGSCTWSIAGPSSDNFIVISFHGYDFGTCSMSNVTVVGSISDVVYGSFCYSNHNKIDVNATTYKVNVRYSARKDSINYKGFNATYLIYSLSKGSSCKLSDQCKASLTCLYGVCNCKATEFFETLTGRCKPKSSFGGNCTDQNQCLGYVNCINRQCACTSEQFYDPASTSCKTKLETKAKCNTSIDGMCRGPNVQCLPDVRVTPRCLCKEDMYQYLESCLFLQDIKVVWPTTGRRTTDSIELRWTPNRNGAIFTYQAIVTPLGRPKEYRRYDARNYGVNITGLQSGQEYNITVLTITSRDFYYNSRNVSVEFATETAPPVPGQINASQSVLSRPPYRLSFQQPSGYVYKYKIVLSDGTSTSTYHVNASEITLTDLKSGTLYFYSITAFNKNGDYSEAVVGNFKTQDDTDQLAVIIGPSVAGVIVIIVISLSVVVIRRRRKCAAKPSVDNKVEKAATPEVERVPLACPNTYRTAPKASVTKPQKKVVISEVNHDYEEYVTLQKELASLGKTNKSTDDSTGTTKSERSVYNNVKFASNDTEKSLAIKDDENVYQNSK